MGLGMKVKCSLFSNQKDLLLNLEKGNLLTNTFNRAFPTHLSESLGIL